MNFFSKIATILVVSVLAFSLFACKESYSIPKPEAPTNLVINSIEEGIGDDTASVNISFNYNGEFYGRDYMIGILGCSITNDSSRASYDRYNSDVHVTAGKNTRTADVKLKLVEGKKYYFWLKILRHSELGSDSDWSNVAEFTYYENK